MQDRYCYEGTNILVNKLNIRDGEELERAEAEFSILRVVELLQSPVKGNFDFEHLKAIHRYLFQDVYDWAGEVRTVDISKGNFFCRSIYIPEFAKTVFKNYFPQCKAANSDPEDQPPHSQDQPPHSRDFSHESAVWLGKIFVWKCVL